MSKNKKVDLAQVFKENEVQQQDTNTPETVESAPANEKIAPSRRGKKKYLRVFCAGGASAVACDCS